MSKPLKSLFWIGMIPVLLTVLIATFLSNLSFNTLTSSANVTRIDTVYVPAECKHKIDTAKQRIDTVYVQKPCRHQVQRSIDTASNP